MATDNRTGPVVVGVNRTQDGSIAVATPHSVYSLQKERVSRRKHHWGRLGDLPRLYLPAMPELRQRIDLVVEGWSSDTEIEHVGQYHAELRGCLQLSDDTPVVAISHHLTHLYSAFPPSPFDSAAGLVVDAQGSRVRDLTENWTPSRTSSGDLLEISTFYRCERGRQPEVLAKQLWDGDWARPAGLGCFYSLLTRTIWPEGEGNEGKAMGLAPFGDPDALGLPPLEVREHEVLIPDEWLKVLDGSGGSERFGHFSSGTGAFEDCADLAAAGQRAFEEAMMSIVTWLRDATGECELVFAGGTALNCSANGRIIREAGFDGVFIPASPHDGGTALGCAVYGLVECLGETSEFRWEHDFLGPEPRAAEIRSTGRAAAGRDDLAVRELCDEELIGAMVDLLEAGQVVALHHGRSESGPRALGNRSIIGDPRVPQMQDYVNFEVKGREWFRPLAPLVLADHAQRIFDVDRPAPFMQYAADVRPHFRAAYPGITHIDGSARLQTVEPVNTPFLHALLSAWYERTGSPVLMNTSLNGPGDPLTETPEQSLETMLRTGMHALVMPPFVITKRDGPPVPGHGWEPPDVPAR